MKKNFVQKLALGLALVMTVTSVPATSEAAAKPAFKTASVSVEEGETTKAVIKGTKGYTIKKVVSKNTEVATIKKVAQKAKKTNVKITGVKAGEAVVKAVLKKGDSKVKLNLNVTVESVAPVVSTVVASTEEMLLVTGRGLAGLTAADVVLPTGYAVENVAVATDGKSATIKVTPAFTADVDYKVSVKGTEFTVKVATKNDSVATKTTVFDSATEDQYMTVNVNGRTYAANSEWLNTEGYTINFTQIAKSVATADDLFNNNETSSNTGLINSEIRYDNTTTRAISGDQSVVYTVDVVVLRDGELVSTGRVDITVEDTDYTVSAIAKDTWTLTGTAKSNYAMNSSTLLVGETATLSSLVGTYRGVANSALLRHAATITTSNKNVIDVSGTNTIIAVGEGSATITIEVGGAKTTHAFTVKANTVRTLNKVTPVLPNGLTTLKLHDSATYAFAVAYTDQFGDSIDATYGADFAAYVPVTKASGSAIAVLTTVSGAGSKAEVLTATANNVEGKGTLRFYNITDGKELTLGSMTLYTTDVDKVDNVIKVEKSVFSTATNAIYNVARYDANGYFYGYEMTLNGINWDSSTTGTPAVNEYFFDASGSALKDYGITITVGTGACGEATVDFTGSGKKVSSSIKVPLYKKTASAAAYQDYALASNVATSYARVTAVAFNEVATIDYIETGINMIFEALDVRETDLPDTTDTYPVVYGLTTSLANDNYIVLKEDMTNGGYEIVSLANDYTTETVVGRVVLEVTSGNIVTTDGRTIDTNATANNSGTLVVRVIGPDAAGVYTNSAYTVAVKAYTVNVK